MYVIGHDHKTVDEEFVPKTGALQNAEKCVTDSRSVQERLPAIAGKGDEVWQAGLVETIESPRHRSILSGGEKPRNQFNCSYGKSPTSAKRRQIWATGDVGHQPRDMWAPATGREGGQRGFECEKVPIQPGGVL